MAAMKHGAKRGSKRGDDENRLLKRDKAFKAQLSRAYGVEKAPPGIGNAMEKALASLPEDTPVQHRPVRRVLRSMAGCAAVLALVFAGLFGLNTTYPQLTEALPGLGPIFVAINGGRTPHPPTDSTESRGGEDDTSSFQPVTVHSRDESVRDLTISNAWSDGRSLCIQLELELSQGMKDYMKSFMYGYGYPEGDSKAGYGGSELKLRFGTSYEISEMPFGRLDDYIGTDPDYHVQVESDGDTYIGPGGLEDIVLGEDGKATGYWRVALDDFQYGGELEVSISLHSLTLISYGQDGWGYHLLEPRYEAEFTVPVDVSRNRVLQGTAIDGQVMLYSVDYAPSRVELVLDIPYNGSIGDLMLGVNIDGIGPTAPLNVFGELETASRSGGGVEYEMYGLWNSWDEVEYVPGMEGTMQCRFVFQPKAGTALEDLKRVPGALRFTLYETPDAWPDLFKRRVTAQFQIDLNTGRLSASEYYKEQGLEKLDTGVAPSDRVQDGVGPICCIIEKDWDESSGHAPGVRVVLLTDPSVETPMTMADARVNAYTGDGTLVTYEMHQTDNEADLYYDIYYSDYTVPSTGRVYDVVDLQLYYPDWLLDGVYKNDPDQTYQRLELVDSAGQVIIYDLEQAWLTYAAQMVGSLKDDVVRGMMPRGDSSLGQDIYSENQQ